VSAHGDGRLYRIAGLGGRYHSLAAVEAVAARLAAQGTPGRIECQDNALLIGPWRPLAWEDTTQGHLGYPPVPGYGDIE